MSGGVYQFEIVLDDKVTPGAKAAKDSLSKARDAMMGMSNEMLKGRKAILGVDMALRRNAESLRGLVEPSRAELATHKAREEALKREKIELSEVNRAMAIQKGEVSSYAMAIRKNLADIGQGGLTDSVSHALARLRTSFLQLGSGDIGGALVSLQAGLKAAGKSALGLAAAFALAYVAYRAAKAIFEVGKECATMAVEAIEAREQMVALFDAMGEGKSSGEQVIGMLDSLRQRTGLTRRELAPLSRDFEAMGKHSLPELKSALLAAASAQAMMGSEGADAFKNLSAKIAEAREANGGLLKMNVGRRNPFAAMGVDLDDVSKKMGITSVQLAAMLKGGTANAEQFGRALELAVTEKGAGPMAKFANSATSLFGIFKENVSKLFEGVDIAPALAGMKELFSLFSTDKASGKAMKLGLTATFNAVFKSAGKFFHLVKEGFLDIEIFAVKAYNALGRILMGNTHGLGVGVNIGRAIGKGIYKALSFAIFDLPNMIGDALWGAGKAIVQGIVWGITGASDIAAGAMIGLGEGLVGSIKGFFGIKSPASKHMPETGASMVQGLAVGAKKEGDKGEVGDAINRAAFQPGSYASSRNGGGEARSSSTNNSRSMNVNFEAHFHGVPEKTAREIGEEVVAVLFEHLQLTQGV